MGYHIYATSKNNNKELQVMRNFFKGSDFNIEGTETAELKVTFNYATTFEKLFNKGGIKHLNDKQIIDTILPLNKAISLLDKNTETNNYWENTEGNVRRCLIELRDLGLLALRVDAESIWKVEC